MMARSAAGFCCQLVWMTAALLVVITHGLEGGLGLIFNRMISTNMDVAQITNKDGCMVAAAEFWQLKKPVVFLSVKMCKSWKSFV